MGSGDGRGTVSRRPCSFLLLFADNLNHLFFIRRLPRVSCPRARAAAAPARTCISRHAQTSRTRNPQARRVNALRLQRRGMQCRTVPSDDRVRARLFASPASVLHPPALPYRPECLGLWAPAHLRSITHQHPIAIPVSPSPSPHPPQAAPPKVWPRHLRVVGRVLTWPAQP